MLFAVITLLTLNQETYLEKFFLDNYNQFFLQAYFEVSANGITRYGLGVDKFNSALILVPRTEEQIAITNYLDRKSAEIDDLIAKKEQLLAFYEEEKTAIINQAVTKGINPDVKMKDSGIEWFGEIPEHWGVKKLKYVTNNVITGKTPPSANKAFYNGDINWFSPGDFNDSLILENTKRKITKLGLEEARIVLFPANTVLLVGIGATLGKIGIIKNEGTSNQQINAVIFNENKISSRYGLYYLYALKDAIIRLANAATLAIFNQSQTKEFEIFVLPLKEQNNIVAYIEKETARIDAKIEKTKNLIALQKEYRMALISEVVTGKIKVTEN